MHNQFWISRPKIRELFLSEPFINLTCDLWTSPNAKAILAVTAHWVDNDFDLKEILLDALEVRRGAHTGVNIARFLLTCLEEFSLKDKLFCITGDNASNNKTMAREIENNITTFETDYNLLGCTGHVFNLAVVAGLSVLGYVARDDIVTIKEDEDRETDVFDFNWGKEFEDETECDANFDPASIVDRVREFCKFVRASPQRRKKSEDCVKDCYSASFRPLSQPTLLSDSAVQLVQAPPLSGAVATIATNPKRSGESLSVSTPGQPARKSARYSISASFLSVVIYIDFFLVSESILQRPLLHSPRKLFRLARKVPVVRVKTRLPLLLPFLRLLAVVVSSTAAPKQASHNQLRWFKEKLWVYY